MKNKIILAVIALLCNTAISAQKLSKDKVPAAILAAFQAKFPKATAVEWEKEGDKEYEANFKSAGVEQSVKYDETAKWLETETEVSATSLPKAVSDALHTQYAGYKVDEAETVDTYNIGMVYEVELTKGKETLEVRLAPDGKVISAQKEGKD